MEYSDLHLTTIVKVEANFGFSDFDIHPDNITKELGIEPDSIRVKGEPRKLRSGKEFITPFNSWYITSKSDSKDINFHMKQLLSRLEGLEINIKPKFGTPSFGILYKSNSLYFGSGPHFEREVIQKIGKYNAELGFDIYQVDQELTEEEQKADYRRLTRFDFE